jgi:TonB family protein
MNTFYSADNPISWNYIKDESVDLTITILRIAFFAIAFAICLQTLGQTSPGKGWVRVETKSSDFSVAFPSADFLVLKDPGKSEIWYNQKGLMFNVRFEKDGNSKSSFKSSSRVFSEPKYKYFQSGDFLGRWYSEKSVENQAQATWFQLASSEGMYIVFVLDRSGPSDITDRFLRSMRLNGKQLINVSVSDDAESQSLKVDTLDSSEPIRQALKKPARTDLKFEKTISSPAVDDEASRIYSRHLTILRRPRAAYTDDAREHNVQGTVKLAVTFLANGTIGSIRLVQGLASGLDRNAFEAARQMKFLPALVDDQPVDVTKIIEYSFTIY